MANTISWPDFAKVEMRVGKILKVDDFPEAHKTLLIRSIRILVMM